MNWKKKFVLKIFIKVYPIRTLAQIARGEGYVPPAGALAYAVVC